MNDLSTIMLCPVTRWLCITCTLRNGQCQEEDTSERHLAPSLREILRDRAGRYRERDVQERRWNRTNSGS